MGLLGAFGKNLSPAETLTLIRDVLWGPDGTDPDREWDSDTIDEVARLVERAGFGPRRGGPGDAPAADYTLDGEPVDVEEFIRDNTRGPAWANLTRVQIRRIRSLPPGEEIVFGGGASAEFVLRRER